MAKAISPASVQLRAWLIAFREGEPTATDELVRHVSLRLHELTRRMLRGYPTVRRWAETDDVFQSALLRLLRALRAVPVTSAREVLALATEQVRRELIDLARHFHGPEGAGRHHASPNPEGDFTQADTSHDPARLLEWAELHEHIGRLPDEERDVFGLLYYQGLKQAEAAAILGIAVRTVQRRWQAALLRLHQGLKSGWPGD
jgi:RNA polymerase sigma factor (sigma-70 family)